MKKYEIKLFQGLDDTFKDEINRHAKIVTFEKKEPLFVDDTLLKYFFIVIDGTVKSYQLNLQNSKEQTISIFQRGDMFDIITLLDNKPHDVMYEALTTTQAMRIPINLVREWIKNSESFNSKFFPYIAKQLRETEELATDLSLYDTYHRLIKLLLSNLDKANKGKYDLIHNLSHSEIAKMIGTVRHVVERHLKELKSENILKSDKRYIEIQNIQKLLEKI